MAIWELARLILIGLATVAGISVLRNPIRVGLNTAAAASYFLGAAGSVILEAWWPIIVAWLLSLTLQFWMARQLASGKYADHVNRMRAAQGLPPLTWNDLKRKDPEEENMFRTFEHAGRRWEASGQGMGTSAQFQRTQWLVQFQCLDDPSEPKVMGIIPEIDPNRVDEEKLVAALEEALILRALDGAEAWLTASEIASAVALDESAVSKRLAMIADVVEEGFPPSVPRRYGRR